MKFSQLGQLALASAVSAAIVLGMTACGQSNTIDFVFVSSANSNPGSIYAFAADGESGALSPVSGSPFPAGRNPVAMVTSPSGLYLYAVNHDDNTVIEYSVGSDGKLYPQNTYPNQTSGSPPGTNATNLAISPDGKSLYVVYAYGLDSKGNPYSASTPGIGTLARYPINANGSLGASASYATCNNPDAVTVSADSSTVYVADNPVGQLATLIDTVAAQNRGATGSATVTYPAVGACSGGTNAVGQINSYVVNATNGSLTPGTGSPFPAGVAPVAVAADPSSRYLYVLDFQSNFVLSYTTGSKGVIQANQSSPSTITGQLPSAITVDPRGLYVYVSNFTDGSVSGYALNNQNGTLSALAGSGSSATQTGPSAVIVEPSTGRYIYTADFVAGTVSGLVLNPNQGTTSQVQNTPFLGPAKATAVAAVKHGDHAVQINPVY